MYSVVQWVFGSTSVLQGRRDEERLLRGINSDKELCTTTA
jgi:hypothetical protein